MPAARTAAWAGRIGSVLLVVSAISVVAQTDPASALPQVAASATATAGLEALMPADALLFVGIADVQRFAHGFTDTAWAHLLADPACADIGAGLERRFDESFGGLMEGPNGRVRAMRSGLHGAFAVCVCLTSPPDDASPIDFGRMEWSFLIAAELAEDHAALDAALEEMRATNSAKSGAETRVVEVGAWRVHESLDVSGAGTPMVTRSTTTDRLGLMEISTAGMNVTEAVLARLENPDRAASLGDQPRFRSSLAARPGGLQIWLDLERLDFIEKYLVDAFGASDEKKWQRFHDFLARSGLLDIEDVAANATAGGVGLRFDLAVRWPSGGGVRAVLERLLAPGKIDQLELLPASTVSATAWRTDLAPLFDMALKELNATGLIEPADVVSTLASVDDGLGVSLRDDLLEAFSGDVVIANALATPDDSSRGSGHPSMDHVLLIGLKGGSAIAPVLERMLRAHGLDAARERVEFEGVETYRLPLSFLRGFTLSLNYAVLPDRLVVATSSCFLRETLRCCAGEADAALPRFADRDDIAGAVEEWGARGGVLNLTGAAQWAHMVTTMVLAEAGAGAVAPPREVFEKHLRGVIWYGLTADDTGIQFVATAP